MAARFEHGDHLPAATPRRRTCDLTAPRHQENLEPLAHVNRSIFGYGLAFCPTPDKKSGASEATLTPRSDMRLWPGAIQARVHYSPPPGHPSILPGRDNHSKLRNRA